MWQLTTNNWIDQSNDISQKLNVISDAARNALCEWMDEEQILHVFDETDNTLDKLWDMWNKRFEILSQYKQIKNYDQKQKNNIFKFLDKKKNEIPENVLYKLVDINKQEQILARALSINVGKNVLSLQQFHLNLESVEKEEDRNILIEFNDKIHTLLLLGKRYLQLSMEHRSLLDLEKQLIDNPNDTLFDVYINKLLWFKDEFEHLITEQSKSLDQYFENIRQDLIKIRVAVENKTSLELIKTSFVSAVARVLVANILWWFISGHNPLTNPYFWQLTFATMPAVTILNYLDYYYWMFAKLTKVMSKWLSFKK